MAVSISSAQYDLYSQVNALLTISIMDVIDNVRDNFVQSRIFVPVTLFAYCYTVIAITWNLWRAALAVLQAMKRLVVGSRRSQQRSNPTIFYSISEKHKLHSSRDCPMLKDHTDVQMREQEWCKVCFRKQFPLIAVPPGQA